MNQLQKERWNEANEMQQKYSNDPWVLENAIRIRHEILKELEEVYKIQGEVSRKVEDNLSKGPK